MDGPVGWWVGGTRKHRFGLGLSLIIGSLYIYIYGYYIGSLGLQIAIGSPSQPSHLTHYGADMRAGGGPLGTLLIYI